MKCDDCINLLEQYLDGEASGPEAEQTRAHLIACASCSSEFELLSAEQEVYARYDREIEISPSLWQGIAARTVMDGGAADAAPSFSLAGWLAGLFAVPRFGFALPAMAVVLLAVMIGLVFLRTKPAKQSPAQPQIAVNTRQLPVNAADTHDPEIAPIVKKAPQGTMKPANDQPLRPTAVAVLPNRPASSNQADVIDASYTDIEDKDTANHLAQAQSLLVSIRSIKFADDNDQVDVSYQKSESRRLLNENIVLRRDAEMAGKFPAKSMLGSLEPFLIDIANLPDKASPGDLRQIRERVQKTEIVAELRAY